MMRITINNEPVQVAGSTYLLTELEDKGIKIDHSCRQGHCGRCKLTLKKGSVSHTDNLVNLKPGEILACCAKPQGNIEITAAN